MVTLLIAIIVLQFAGANMGAHQLHKGNSLEEVENHPHLQFSAPVITFTQCVDCECPSGQEWGDDALLSSDISSVSDYSHLLQTVEIQNFDLCLDCQCHGGHVALLSHLSNQAVTAFEMTYVLTNLTYFPPEQLPKYRPPIA